MSARFEASRLGELPLWAQVVLATRMLRRATQTLLPGEPAEGGAPVRSARRLITGVCDRLDKAAIAGVLPSREREAAKADEETYGKLTAPGVAQRALDTLGMMMHWCIDCAHAADSAQDFPIDSTITADVHRVIAQLTAHPGINSLQVAITLSGDVDLVHFACDEIKVGRYFGVTDHLFGRLPPVHALTVEVLPGRGRVTEKDYR